MRAHRFASFIVAGAIVLGLSTPGLARSPCDGRALPDGPLPVGFSQRDFGIVRSACPRTSVGVGIDGRAIVENENFYGNIRAAARVDASFQPFDQLELFTTVEPLAYQLVIQSFRDDHLGVGDTSVGATLLAFARQRFALSVMARADLPTAYGYYQNSFPIGVEGGLLMLLEPVNPLRLHGGLLIGHRTAFTRATGDPRTALIANAGADFVIEDWLAFVIDLNGQVLERGDLDHLSVAVGARFAVFDDIGIEVGANLPFAGDERNLAAFVLRTAYRF
jgi:hypothetical protein